VRPKKWTGSFGVNKGPSDTSGTTSIPKDLVIEMFAVERYIWGMYMRSHSDRYVHMQAVEYIAIFSCESLRVVCIHYKSLQEQLLLGPV
jgi:hypothetical protein